MLPIILLTLRAQDFCQTVGGGAGSIGAIVGSNSNGNNPSVPSGPYNIRVYVHAIRHLDGTGGPTDETIRNAFERLNADFNPHNIFFVRDCGVIDIPVSEDDYYGGIIWCDLWENPLYQHSDGIDMFIGPDDTNWVGGIVMDIPSKAMWVTGLWFAGGCNCLSAESPVISHEMGHCLGLWHTHHGTIEEVGQD